MTDLTPKLQLSQNLSQTLIELDKAVTQWQSLISSEKACMDPLGLSLTQEKDILELPEKTRRLLHNLKSQLDELSK